MHRHRQRLGLARTIAAAAATSVVLYSLYAIAMQFVSSRYLRPLPLQWHDLVNANWPVATDHIVNLLIAATIASLIVETRRTLSQ
jgi:uncharacterized protein with PQ loop repeat